MMPMEFLSEDDLDIRNMTEQQRASAWWFWFTLAQSTNDSDPPYSHGVLTTLTWDDIAELVGIDAANELRRMSSGCKADRGIF